MRRNGSVGAELAKGAIAGAVATWAMTKVTTVLYEHEDRSARQREERARGGKTAYRIAAEKGAASTGVPLREDELERAGQAIHWGLGIGAGAVYGVLRPRVRRLGKAAGLAYGTGFWLLLDEIAVPALGLTPGPTGFPWQTHARGLAGHLSFGAVADATLNVLDRVV